MYKIHVCTKSTRQVELTSVPAKAHSGAVGEVYVDIRALFAFTCKTKNNHLRFGKKKNNVIESFVLFPFLKTSIL